MKAKPCTTALVAISMIGCSAQNVRPVVDKYRTDMVAYERDLKECQSLAEHENPVAKAMLSALIVGAAGAAMGAAIGAPSGNADYGAKTGAAMGAGMGAGAAGSESANTMRRIVYNCMRQRNYVPLD